MFSTLRNAWKVPELRKRLLWTVFLILIYRLGNAILVPDIDRTRLANLTAQQGNSLLGFYDLLSGGAFSKLTIFAMGVTPYINASIVMQLLTVAIPRLESLQKEGEEGRKKIQNYTRYAAIVFGIIQSVTVYVAMVNFGVVIQRSWLYIFLIVAMVTTASTFLMWLGDQITVKGVGNGISLLIFVNIISRVPMQFMQVKTAAEDQSNQITIIVFALLLFALLFSIIVMSLAERRIPVQYAGKTVGNKVFKGQSTHIPINLNASGIIAIIFAMSVMEFPNTLARFWPTKPWAMWIMNSPYSVFVHNSVLYAVVDFILVVFFTWFYTEITMKPDEMAENMHKSAGFIPGIRPGEPTAIYITKVLAKISFIGGVFAGIIATFPMIFEAMGISGLSFSGTSMLIMIGVAVETSRQLEAQLVMRHYQGFLK